jgi:hypothetical protein
MTTTAETQLDSYSNKVQLQQQSSGTARRATHGFGCPGIGLPRSWLPGTPKTQTMRCRYENLRNGGCSRMTGPVHHRIPLLMYGILLVCLGIAMYLFGVLIALPRHLLVGGERLLAFNEWIVWYSGMPLMLGLGLAIVDLFLLFKNKRSPQLEVRYDPIADPRLVGAHRLRR